ncbi:Piwi domain-containing protein [Cercophora scortea]|uniref:Piwi domain-containing protein n=1 Tax=Cercophora scortea TaxID=314031 RepID=A0AAE0I714_9PEZI|nr:Piwi domain-containing protein [Cercophora scortea]
MYGEASTRITAAGENGKKIEDELNEKAKSLKPNPISLSSGQGNAGGSSEHTRPQRPGYSGKGEVVNLWANCIELNPPEETNFYRYTVNIKRRVPDKKDKEPAAPPSATKKGKGKATDDVASPGGGDDDVTEENVGDDVNPRKRKRGHIILRLLKTDPELKDAHEKGLLVTDFHSTIICTKELTEQFHIVNYCGEKSRYRFETFKVTLTAPEAPQSWPNPLSLQDLVNYLRCSDLDNIPNVRVAEFIQTFNIWLRHISKYFYVSTPQKYTVVGGKAYSLWSGSPTMDLLGGVQSTRGYFSSVRLAASRILANVNVTHGTFFFPGPLRELINKSGFAGRYEELEKFVKGVRVSLRHRTAVDTDGQEIAVVKAISGLAWTSDGENLEHPPLFHRDLHVAKKKGPHAANANQVKFYGVVDDDTKKMEYRTVFEYFQRKYPTMGVQKFDLLVNVGSKANPEYYPVTVCDVVPGQNYIRKLSPSQTAEMIGFAVMKPRESIGWITQFGLRTISLSRELPAPQFFPSSQHIRTLNPQKDLLVVDGRRLPQPDVLFARRKRHMRTPGGSWNLDDRESPENMKIRYSVPAVVPQWGMLIIQDKGNLGPTKDQGNAICQQLEVLMAKRGMKKQGPRRTTEVMALNDSNLLDPTGFRKLIETMKGCKLLFVLFSRALSQPNYATLKKVADVDLGIHAICMIQSKACSSQYQDNVLLKANLKLGGDNQHLNFNSRHPKLIDKDKTLILGLDVTHPSKGADEQTNKSVVGMVANVDGEYQRWAASIELQTHSGQEIMISLDSMKTLLRPHLVRWRDRTRSFPTQLILYRDGVSEGQYDQVVRSEYRLLHDAYTIICGPGNPKPKITIVIVGKRHHMRFYPAKENASDRKGNALPGTLVDRGVTSQYLWEFYLQAHEAIQGTARPAHYVVVADDIFRSLGKAQMSMAGFGNASEVLHDFTHALCYALGRCTRSISVCAPARLADKVCDRARLYLHTGRRQDGPLAVHQNLVDSMFYI